MSLQRSAGLVHKGAEVAYLFLEIGHCGLVETIGSYELLCIASSAAFAVEPLVVRLTRTPTTVPKPKALWNSKFGGRKIVKPDRSEASVGRAITLVTLKPLIRSSD